jgi:transcription initiation factor TFIIH subunit 1
MVERYRILHSYTPLLSSVITKHLLLAEAASEGQKRGRPGQLVDPRPQTVEGGEVKIVITPQLVHDIFDEFPVVAKAYNDNVPNKVRPKHSLIICIYKAHLYKLSEAEFWKRYFQSKLFNAHRASIRSSAAQHVVKDDPIFDKYLEKDDDGTPLLSILKFIPVILFNRARAAKSTKRSFRPLHQYRSDTRRPWRSNTPECFVRVLSHLKQTGNEKDVTMQAGRQRGALPLIRKFNEHSERLLNSALSVPSSY